MNLSSLQLSRLRDCLHNLDLNQDEDKAFFLGLAQFYVTDAEGFYQRAYDDETRDFVTPKYKPKGKVTIGIGFNMSRGGARKE